VLVSPIGIRAFFSEWGWRVIQTELVWIWLPALAFVGLSSLVRRRAGGPD
jgi:inner membrane protein